MGKQNIGARYQSISFDKPFITEIKKFKEGKDQYRSVADFAREAIREKMKMEDECLEHLIEVIHQACDTRECPHAEYHLDSMAISAYADAIRYLAKINKASILTQSGRRVIAKWNKP